MSDHQKQPKTWPDGKALKSVKEVAKFIDRHPNTLYSWVAEGQLECIRLPRNKLAFTFDQVQDFINSSRERVSANLSVLDAA